MKKIQHKVSSRTLITNIINSIQTYFDVNRTPFNSILSLTNQIYSTGEYNFLPIYIDNDEEMSDDKYDLIIAGKFIHYFSPYIYILKHIENDLSIKGLKSSKIVVDSGTNTIDKEYNNSLTSNGTDKDVSENAPITADIDTINTPNYKSRSIFDKNSTKTGKDTDTHTTSNNMEETNPELFYKYMVLYREYNIIDIVDKCYRRIIAEFNSAI